jgi:ribosomal protein S18 acetylase RimI-like enzyme
MPLRFGALGPRHRGRLAEILAATGVFSRDEVAVGLELFDEAFGGGSGEVGGGSSLVDAPTSHLSAPPCSYEFLGLFADDDTLLGYACYGPTPGTDRTFDLYWIAMHPAVQGTGEGSRLLSEIERRLCGRGGRLLIVETSSRTPYAPTRRFYDSRGYGEAARVADFYAPADDRVIYTKRLTAADAAPAVRPPSAH